MKNKSPEPDKTALKQAYRYLGIRDRTVYEIREYLKRKEHSGEVIEQSITLLKQQGLLDDRAFAAKYSEEKAGHYGIKLLRRKLEQYGIEDIVIEEALSGISRDEQLEAARAIQEKKMYEYSSMEPEKAGRRCFSLLMGRGFEAGIAGKVAREMMHELKERQSGGHPV